MISKYEKDRLRRRHVKAIRGNVIFLRPSLSKPRPTPPTAPEAA